MRCLRLLLVISLDSVSLTSFALATAFMTSAPMRAAAQADARPWERVAGDKSMQGCGVDFQWTPPSADKIRLGLRFVYWGFKNSCGTNADAVIYTDDMPNGDHQIVLANSAPTAASRDGSWTSGTAVTNVVVTMQGSAAVATSALHDAAVDLLAWWNGVVQSAASAARQAEANPFGNVGAPLKEYTDLLAQGRDQALQLQQLLGGLNGGADVVAQIQRLESELRADGQAVQRSAQGLAAGAASAKRQAVADSVSRGAKLQQTQELLSARQAIQADAVREQRSLIAGFNMQDNRQLEDERRRIQSDLDGDAAAIRSAYRSGSNQSDPASAVSAMREAVKRLQDRAEETFADKQRTNGLSTSLSSGAVLRGFGAALTGDRGAADRYAAFSKAVDDLAEVHDTRKERLTNAADEIDGAANDLAANTNVSRRSSQAAGSTASGQSGDGSSLADEHARAAPLPWNVVLTSDGKLHPLPGFDWVDPATVSDIRVRPAPNLIENPPGTYAPVPGFDWVSAHPAADRDYRVKPAWNLMEVSGAYQPVPGFVWVSASPSTDRDYRVQPAWNLVADPSGSYHPMLGFDWTSSNPVAQRDYRVKPARRLVLDSTGGYRPLPGFEWVSAHPAIDHDYRVKPPWNLVEDSAGVYRPLPGFTWIDATANQDYRLRPAQGLQANADGTYTPMPGFAFVSANAVSDRDYRVVRIASNPADGADVPHGAPGSPSTSIADALYSRGRSEYAAGDYATARRDLQASCKAGSTLGCSGAESMIKANVGAPAEPTAPSNISAHARFDSAEAAYRSKNYGSARNDYHASCDGGVASACNTLGYLVQMGLGGPIDLAAARDLYVKGCDGGHGNACTTLGILMERGIGGAADTVGARAQFARGCDRGSSQGCGTLGRMLERGLGGSVDTFAAQVWFMKGCDLGGAPSCLTLGQTNLHGISGLTHKPAARTWFSKGCDAGSAQACGSLADLLEKGIGGPPDAAKAKVLFVKACAGGEQELGCTRIKR